MDLDAIRRIRDELRHHRSGLDKIPAVCTDGKYSYLKWEYDDEKVTVKARNRNSELIAMVKKTIELYLDDEDERRYY